MTIKTIISPEDEKEFYRLASLVGTDARDPRRKLMVWLERFDANRRSTLLDEIERDTLDQIQMNSMEKQAFLSTLNKYRV